MLTGHYCILGAQSATPSDGVTGDLCAPGYLCTTGSCNQTACTEGYYCSSTGNVPNLLLKCCVLPHHCL